MRRSGAGCGAVFRAATSKHGGSEWVRWFCSVLLLLVCSSQRERERGREREREGTERERGRERERREGTVLFLLLCSVLLRNPRSHISHPRAPPTLYLHFSQNCPALIIYHVYTVYSRFNIPLGDSVKQNIYTTRADLCRGKQY